MRTMLLHLLALGAAACGQTVERLDLHDPRLPDDARRWLADNEDEVSIAKASFDVARRELDDAETYRDDLATLVKRSKFEKTTGAEAEGRDAAKALVGYADQLVALREMELEAAETALARARAALTRTDAETAMRFDIAVYEVAPLVQEVDRLSKSLGAMQLSMERQRATVEKAADNAWRAFSKYVKKGGVTNALFGVSTHKDM